MIYLLFFNIIFDSFFPVIILKTCIFKSFVLFGTHTSLHKSLGALQLPTHLSNLHGFITQMDTIEILAFIH